MALLCTVPRRGVTLWIIIALVIIVIYIPLNVVYILATPALSRSALVEENNEKMRSKKTREESPLKVNFKETGNLLQMQDIHIKSDGSIDLNVNVNIVDMMKILHAYSDGSFNGEMTSNPLPKDFPFIISNDKVCSDAPNLDVLYYIHSAASNDGRRKIIRSTWTHDNLFTDFFTRRVFLMGRPSTENEKRILEKESKEFGDIVVGDFNDNYKNLTHKAIMGLKWTSLYCPQAKYVFKADDDAFVNIFEIRKTMKSYESKKVFICPLWKENTMPILRDPSKCMKWCVRFNEFPGKTHFPKYCAGLAYVMSQKIVPQLYKAALSTPFFWIDDVYVSGMLAPKVQGLEYVDLLQNFTLKENLAADDYLKPSSHKVTYYFAHVKKANVFYSMWNATLHRLSPSELGNIGDFVFQRYPTLIQRKHSKS